MNRFVMQIFKETGTVLAASALASGTYAATQSFSKRFTGATGTFFTTEHRREESTSSGESKSSDVGPKNF